MQDCGGLCEGEDKGLRLDLEDDGNKQKRFEKVGVMRVNDLAAECWIEAKKSQLTRRKRFQ